MIGPAGSKQARRQFFPNCSFTEKQAHTLHVHIFIPTQRLVFNSDMILFLLIGLDIILEIPISHALITERERERASEKDPKEASV